MLRLFKAVVVLAVLPLCWLFRAGALRFETGSFLLAGVPGVVGRWWRTAWYERTLRRCGRWLKLNWMAYIYTADSSMGNSVYIGPYSSVGWADIGDNVLIAARVSLTRGAHQHGFARLDIPMNQQPVRPQKLTIGSDVWIGTGAIIMADVAPGTIVGAGAVVTHTFEPYSILAGVPARVIGRRGAQAAREPEAATAG